MKKRLGVLFLLEVILGSVMVFSACDMEYAHSPATETRENIIEATEETQGSYDEVIYCEKCGEELSRKRIIIEKLVVENSCDHKGLHEPGNEVEENWISSTCSSEGSYDIAIYCKHCNIELSRTNIILPTIEHTPQTTITVENKIDPSCDEDGSYDSVVYCSLCNQEMSRITAIIPKRHNYADGFCISCGDEQLYVRNERKITFGSYPQTNVSDSALITSLNNLVGALPTSSDSGKWISYGYYLNDTDSNYMWYVDIELEEDKYRGVYFTSYRPYSMGYSDGSATNSHQDDHGYYTSTVYWFKYEPISWSIISEENGTAIIFCDMIIDTESYQNEVEYDSNTDEYHVKGTTACINNYEKSTIRAWLNDNFYNTAFSESEKRIILATIVDNSVESTGVQNIYICDDTEDKIFLLSREETIKIRERESFLGVSTSKVVTDYAQCQGVALTSTSNEKKGWWWLRSPYEAAGTSTYGIQPNGLGMAQWSSDICGVVPALRIKLEN